MTSHLLWLYFHALKRILIFWYSSCELNEPREWRHLFVLWSRTALRCCEQVLFPTRLDQLSNKKRHRTKSLWYTCSKGHKRKRSEQFLWDNMHVKQQGKDFMIIPWCSEEHNAQLLQDELTCKTRVCQLKEGDQRASRVKHEEQSGARYKNDRNGALRLRKWAALECQAPAIAKWVRTV